jgi:hypothetical protein
MLGTLVKQIMADADPTDSDACSDTFPQLEDFKGTNTCCVTGDMSFDESSSDNSDDDDNDPTYIFDGSDSSDDNDDLYMFDGSDSSDDNDDLSLTFDEARDVAKGKRAPHTVSSRDVNGGDCEGKGGRDYNEDDVAAAQISGTIGMGSKSSESHKDDGGKNDKKGDGDAVQIPRTIDMDSKSSESRTVDGGKKGCRVASYSGKYWDKNHCCVYCKKLYTKLPRHFEQVHKDECDVGRALSFPPKSEGRNKIWTELRQKGDFAHNKEVLKNQEGSIITRQRPQEEGDASNYVPCTDCFGMFKAKALWRHRQRCKLSSAKSKKRGMGVRDGRLLLPISSEVNLKFRRDILETMKRDAQQLVAANDKLILRFGQSLFAKHVARQHQYQYVKQKMRELARFVLRFRELDPTVESLSEMIDPLKFRTCVKAVQMMSGFDEETGKCKVPSVGLKVGHSLKKCGKLLKSDATEKGDHTTRKQAKHFISMYDDNWLTHVSTFALETLEANRFNKPQRIPLTEDIQRLHRYLEEKASDLHEKLLSTDTEKSEPIWRDLSEVTLAQIVLFNRRRGGEAERIEVQQVEQGLLSGKNLQDEIMAELSPFEQRLAKSLERIEIRGKRNRRVPVLLTQKYKERVDSLLKKRPRNLERTFLFLRGTEAKTTLSTSDVLRKFARESGAKQPQLLTSTKLRKHIATMSQVLNLKEHELDILADFLGHDIAIHRHFYRLSEDTMQLAKVSKLLLELESGNVVKHKGKTLDEIQIDEAEELEEDDAMPQGIEGEETNDKEADAVAINEAVDSSPEMATPPPKKKKCNVPRKKWSDAEKQAVERQLGKFLRIKKLPGKSDCENARRNEPSLQGRPWTQLKFYIKNSIPSTLKKKAGMSIAE